MGHRSILIARVSFPLKTDTIIIYNEYIALINIRVREEEERFDIFGPRYLSLSDTILR